MVGSEGRPTQSQLETYVRRTTALYAIMSQREIDPRPPWTGADGQGKEQLATVSLASVLGSALLKQQSVLEAADGSQDGIQAERVC